MRTFRFSWGKRRNPPHSTTPNIQVSQQLATYQAIASGSPSVNFLSTAGTGRTLHIGGNIVEDVVGSQPAGSDPLYAFVGKPGSINLGGQAYSTDTADWSLVTSSNVPNPAIEAQITFDQNEIATIESQMLAEGTGAWEVFDPNVTQGFDVVAPGTTGAIFVPINKVVQETINIPAFTAQAGQINIYGDQISGTGILRCASWPAPMSISSIPPTPRRISKGSRFRSSSAAST